MTFKDIGFRSVYHRFGVIDINDTIRKSCSDFPGFEKADCVLLYGYIDHDAGTTMEVIACGHRDNDGCSFYEAPADIRCFIRIAAIENETFYDLNYTFDELKAKKQAVKEWLWENMHGKTSDTIEKLNRKLSGHYAYYGISGNWEGLLKFYRFTVNAFYNALTRRSQRAYLTSKRYYILY